MFTRNGLNPEGKAAKQSHTGNGALRLQSEMGYFSRGRGFSLPEEVYCLLFLPEDSASPDSQSILLSWARNLWGL
jgi:hypothetical protein